MTNHRPAKDRRGNDCEHHKKHGVVTDRDPGFRDCVNGDVNHQYVMQVADYPPVVAGEREGVTDRNPQNDGQSTHHKNSEQHIIGMPVID